MSLSPEAGHDLHHLSHRPPPARHFHKMVHRAVHRKNVHIGAVHLIDVHHVRFRNLMYEARGPYERGSVRLSSF